MSKEENEKILLSKLNDLEKKVLYFLNIKLKTHLTGNEIKIDLNNKNIGNVEINLLSGIEFKNLEELNLSHNNITNPDFIKDFNLKKLKKLDLSFNRINKINENKMNEVYLSFDKINNKSKIIASNKNIEINLSNNNLLKKDIEEIKNIILDNNNVSESVNKNINDNSIKLKKKRILNRIDKLEKKILYYLNAKLNVRLTGKEIKIELNNKNIGNEELILLSGIQFNNLEELNLSLNNISDIEPLKNFQKLKKLDLSFNKINNIKPLKEIINNNIGIIKIDLKNNLIKDIEVIKNSLFPSSIDINLDNNLIIKKDLDEIKSIINKKNNNKIKDSKLINNENSGMLERNKNINLNTNEELNSMKMFKSQMLGMVLGQINNPMYQKYLMEMDSQKINNFNNTMNYLMGNNMLQNYISHFIPKDSINKDKKINFPREKHTLSYELGGIGNSPK